MSAGYSHKCNKCGYSVSTSGPWEFYRDSKGERKWYGHPLPLSDEAKSRGIYGPSGILYCPYCDEMFDRILVELRNPSHDSLSVWLDRCEPIDEFKGKSAVKCPRCGHSNLILGPVQDREIACPRCKEGTLMGKMDWVS
jgi:hypothetical protein